MTDSPAPLPPLQVRESARARRVSLRVSATAGLEIVVPRGFAHVHIPAIVARHRAWIDAQWARLVALDRTLPPRLELPATGEGWTLLRRDGPQPRLRRQGDALVITGASDAEARVLLRRFLMAHARLRLGECLDAAATATGLRYTRLSIRAQRGRWGSCSARGAISLNVKLLFLEPALVRHVLVHELCHTVHLNHSPAFWKVVADHDPDWRRLRAELQARPAMAPAWIEA